MQLESDMWFYIHVVKSDIKMLLVLIFMENLDSNFIK